MHKTKTAPNLPEWPSADAAYSKAYAALQNMAQRGHATPAVVRKGRVVVPGKVSEQMQVLIDALNKGDEEKIKGFLLQSHIYF